MIRASHALLEKEYTIKDHFPRVLEVGAGTGQHLAHVKHRFDEYTISDQQGEMLTIAKSNNAHYSNPGKLIYSIQDAAKLDFPDCQFDRLIATHVLEHMPFPHIVLREWTRVIRPGGVLSILLPCDPGLAWRIGRKCGPRRAAEKAGIPYDYWMAREHINAINNLIALIEFYFQGQYHSQWYPFPFSSTDLNLFFSCNIRIE